METTKISQTRINDDEAGVEFEIVCYADRTEIITYYPRTDNSNHKIVGTFTLAVPYDTVVLGMAYKQAQEATDGRTADRVG